MQGKKLIRNDLEIGDFRLPSSFKEDDNQWRWFARLFCSFTELLRCSRFFGHRPYSAGVWFLKSFYKVVLQHAERGRFGGDGILFVISAFEAKSFPIVLVARCLKHTVTIVLIPRFLTTLSNSAFKILSEYDQPSTFWVWVLSKTQWCMMSMIKFSVKEMEELLMPSAEAFYAMVKKSLMVFPARALIFSRWAMLMADFTSDWIRKLEFSLCFMIVWESVLLDALWIQSPLFLTCFTFGAFLCNVAAQAFRSTALPAALAWRPDVVASRFIIVWKDALTTQSAR